MKENILITVPNLSAKGGVSVFWNALLQPLKEDNKYSIDTLEIGGHGKNIFGPLLDQKKFSNSLKKNKPVLSFLNPSLNFRSFFRDAFFAKKLIKSSTPFIVFFHGWNINFEKKVTNKYKKFFINTFGKADTIFVLSEDFKSKIIKWGYKGKIIVETTNIDSTLLKNFTFDMRKNYLDTSNDINILFLARLLKEKGIFETISAFEKISEKYPNVNLFIAGDGEAFSEVEHSVKNNDKIKLLGHIDGEDKVSLFKKSHIYCLPSYSEGLPTSVLEAMAFGLPVVTTSVGGLRDFFQEGKMGYFVEEKKSDDILNKLELLISSKESMKIIGKYNYDYANENLLNTIVAKRIENEIDLIIDRKVDK